MGRIFGTDGIRGVAGVDMTPELALDLGRAAATVVKERGNTHPHFLIGRDTRISGGMLESAIAAGLCSVGADVTLLGVITTPGVAYLARKYQADGAFVISASHNPYEYNGIKLFDAEGYKFPDSYEEEIEELILDDLRMYALVDGQDFGRIRVDNDARTDYVEYLAGCWWTVPTAQPAPPPGSCSQPSGRTSPSSTTPLTASTSMWTAAAPTSSSSVPG